MLSSYWNTDYVHAISNDAGRTMMGSRQEHWFYNQLGKSAKRGATWRIIGSQTVFSRQNESIVYGNADPLDYDAWDGYQVISINDAHDRWSLISSRQIVTALSSISMTIRLVTTL